MKKLGAALLRIPPSSRGDLSAAQFIQAGAFDAAYLRALSGQAPMPAINIFC